MNNVKILLLSGFFSLLASCNQTASEQIDFNSFGVTSDAEIAAGKYSIHDRMKRYKVPGVSIAVVLEGRLDWAKGYGIANSTTGYQVETDTLFQAASISKPITALAVLKLFENSKIDLDENVNSYLSDWSLVEDEFTTTEKVTLRRLLTHTAGINVHGFPGYRQEDELPKVEDVLRGNGNTDQILVDAIPGNAWRYSGGGYTIIQKVIEDISGLPFQEYMNTNVLSPLDMTNSTYQQPLPSSLYDQASAAYYSNGNIIEGLWHNYPEQAAAGLWTTPTDLAKYVIQIQSIYSDNTAGFLSKDTIDMMLTRHENGWGLGPRLLMYQGSLMFQHSGKNAGFSTDMFASASKDFAIIIMTNGDNGEGLITEIRNSILSYYDL